MPTCVICHTDFSATQATAIYCSQPCKYVADKQRDPDRYMRSYRKRVANETPEEHAQRLAGIYAARMRYEAKLSEERKREIRDRQKELARRKREQDPEKVNAAHRAYYARNKEKMLQYMRERNRRLRIAAFEAYGGQRCTCCGETQYEFLAIDHIHNNGYEERKKYPGQSVIWRWLLLNNYPPGFQVLCHNCNLAKGWYGNCPHVDSVKVDASVDLPFMEEAPAQY